MSKFSGLIRVHLIYFFILSVELCICTLRFLCLCFFSEIVVDPPFLSNGNLSLSL